MIPLWCKKKTSPLPCLIIISQTSRWLDIHVFSLDARAVQETSPIAWHHRKKPPKWTLKWIDPRAKYVGVWGVFDGKGLMTATVCVPCSKLLSGWSGAETWWVSCVEDTGSTESMYHQIYMQSHEDVIFVEDSDSEFLRMFTILRTEIFWIEVVMIYINNHWYTTKFYRFAHRTL